MYCFAGPSVIGTHASDDLHPKQSARKSATLPLNLGFGYIASGAITRAHSLQRGGIHNTGTPPILGIE